MVFHLVQDPNGTDTMVSSIEIDSPTVVQDMLKLIPAKVRAGLIAHAQRSAAKLLQSTFVHNGVQYTVYWNANHTVHHATLRKTAPTA